MSSVYFQPITWYDIDIDGKGFVSSYGQELLPDGNFKSENQRIVILVRFNPFFVISAEKFRKYEDIFERYRGKPYGFLNYEIYQAFPFHGAQMETSSYVKIFFQSFKAKKNFYYTLFNVSQFEYSRELATQNQDIAIYHDEIEGCTALSFDKGFQPYMPMNINLYQTDSVNLKLISETVTFLKSNPAFRECAKYEICFPSDIQLLKTNVIATKPRILSIDIEAYSESGHFPDPTIETSEIFMISLVTNSIPDGNSNMPSPDELVKYVISKYEINDIPDCRKCFVVKNERQLLKQYLELVEKINPDLITGFNVNSFDFPYIEERIRRINSKYSKSKLSHDPISRYIGKGVYYSEVFDKANMYKKKNEKQKVLGTYKIPGIVCFDTLPVIQRKYKLPSYKLNSVSKHFIDDQKDDISAEDMFICVKNTNQCTDPEKKIQLQNQMTDIATYCIQDSALVINLVTRLDLVIQFFQHAQECRTSIQVPASKLMSHLLTVMCVVIATQFGYVLDKIAISELITEYEGGFVGIPLIDKIILYLCVVDFNSLYPSIIIAFNLCSSTRIYNKDLHKYTTDMYMTFDKDEYDLSETIYILKESVKPSLLSQILKSLLSSRKCVKNEMKNIDPETLLYKVKDQTQLTMKEIANSLYGVLGAKFGVLRDPKIAELITAIGRHCTQNLNKNLVAAKSYREIGIWALPAYNDTDSAFVMFGNIPCSLDETLHKIDTLYHGAERSIFMEFHQCCVSLLEMLNTDVFRPTLVDAFINLKKKYILRQEDIRSYTQKLIKEWNLPNVKLYLKFCQLLELDKQENDSIIIEKLIEIYENSFPYRVNIKTIEYIGQLTEILINGFLEDKINCCTNKVFGYAQPPMFKEPLKVECERVGSGFFLSKKKYYIFEIKNGQYTGKLYQKGTPQASRSIPKFIKDICQNIARSVFENATLKSIFNSIATQFYALACGEIPLEDLAGSLSTTKSMSEIDDTNNQKMCQVVRRQTLCGNNTLTPAHRFNIVYASPECSKKLYKMMDLDKHKTLSWVKGEKKMHAGERSFDLEEVKQGLKNFINFEPDLATYINFLRPIDNQFGVIFASLVENNTQRSRIQIVPVKETESKSKKRKSTAEPQTCKKAKISVLQMLQNPSVNYSTQPSTLPKDPPNVRKIFSICDILSLSNCHIEKAQEFMGYATSSIKSYKFKKV